MAPVAMALHSPRADSDCCSKAHQQSTCSLESGGVLLTKGIGSEVTSGISRIEEQSVFIRVHPWPMLFLVGLASAPGIHAQGGIPPLPDSTGWGVHVLAVARDAQGSIWVGTYGQGIYRLPL